jgi:hypothetical protein
MADSKRSSAAPLGILDRPLARGRGEVNLASFSLLFSEIVQYSFDRIHSVPDLEKRFAPCAVVSSDQPTPHALFR